MGLEHDGAGGPREVRRRGRRAGAGSRWWQRLPSRRSVTGAALVALSAIGVLVAHRAAVEPPTTRYVVATADLPAGQVLRASDLGAVAMDLPGGIPAVPAEDARELVGRVTRTGIERHALVRPGDLLARDRLAEPGSVEVAVELQPARALRGTLTVGDRVDVLATDPDSTGTRTVAGGALVTAVGDDGGDGIGSSSTVLVRLGLPDRDVASAVVDASIRSELSLVLPAPVEEPTR